MIFKQINIKVQETKTYYLFVVPIGNAKIEERIDFHPRSPVIKFHQESSNSCCLSSLSIFVNKAGTALE